MAHYIVAGHHEWSIKLYKELVRNTKDKWWFCSEPGDFYPVLNRVIPSKIFFVHWSYIVPKPIINNYECICFHPTDLPFGRGGTPIQNLIELGEEETVITAFRMTDEIDAGPIYCKEYGISLSGTAQDIYERISWRILDMILYKILLDNELPYPQEGEPTYFKRRTPADSVMVAGQPLEKQYDFIRMLDAENYPHAYLYYGNYRLEFTDAQLKDGKLTAKVTFEDVSK